MMLFPTSLGFIRSIKGQRSHKGKNTNNVASFDVSCDKREWNYRITTLHVSSPDSSSIVNGGGHKLELFSSRREKLSVLNASAVSGRDGPWVVLI